MRVGSLLTLKKDSDLAICTVNDTSIMMGSQQSHLTYEFHTLVRPNLVLCFSFSIRVRSAQRSCE